MRLFVVPILLLVMLLPDLYIDSHFFRRRHASWRKRLAWWSPVILLLAFLGVLTSVNTFEPQNMHWLNLFLLLFGVLFIPKFLFSVFSLAGLLICKLVHSHHNYGNIVGLVTALFGLYIIVYGAAFGMSKLRVRHVDYYSASLPSSFDGYRIVQFSDAHVGTYGGDTSFVSEAVDSINSQSPDAVMFCGDIVNVHPSELHPFLHIFPRLKAPDGVYSVLGNHDYSLYTRISVAQRIADVNEIKARERKFGWHLLLNSHQVIRRGGDSIVVAGEENDGRPPFPALGNIARTMHGVDRSAFVIMLQHDPTSWRTHILPQTQAHLTLSGHTHAMQFQLFGWSPSSWVYREWGGMFTDGGRAISVSKGLGGFIYFRYGAWPEINVITLHKTHQ